jgi:ABC-type multidrug transport system fused ATPase/permease subunit
MKNKNNQMKKESNSRRLFRYIARQKKLIGFGILATLFMSLVDLATGGLLKFLTNQLSKIEGLFTGHGVDVIKFPLKYNIKIPLIDQKINLLNTTLKGSDAIFKALAGLSIVFLTLYLLLALFNYLRRVFMNAATQRILQQFKSDIYNKILRLPYTFFTANKTGDVVSRVTYDVTTLNEIIDLLIEVARASVYVLVFIPVMFYMSWQLSLFTILFFPLSVVFIDFVTRKIKRVSKSITDNVGDYTAFLEERINRFKLIKSFGKESAESQTFTQLVEDNYQYNLRLIKLRYSMNPTNDFLGMILLTVVYLFYSYKLTHGATSLGDIVFFLFLVKTAFKPVKKVAEAWGQLHVALVSTKKIFRLLDADEESSESEKDVDQIDSLSLHQLSFTHKDSTNTLLKNIDLSVEKGSIIALTGKTGVGKSTLLNLIAGFFKADSGELLVNNLSTNEWSLKSLRAKIILVEGASPYFNGSIFDNLTYSGKSVSTEVIAQYCKFLGFEKVEQLHQQIGTEGIALSMGQQQKLAFLRALVANPEVLLLDEIFSSLDEEDIQFIFDACKKIPMLIVVSRKLSVLNYASATYNLDEGGLHKIK